MIEEEVVVTDVLYFFVRQPANITHLGVNLLS